MHQHQTRRRARAGLAAMALVATSATLAPFAGSAGAVVADPDVTTGPSTTVRPYVLPVADGVEIRSLLTVDDQPAGNGRAMVGVPDGLGVTRRGDRAVVLMNHELRNTAGAVRDHGQIGAFVSRNVVDPDTGKVLATSDLIQAVRFWDYAGARWGAVPSGAASAAFNRFCSGSLSDPGVLRSGHLGFGGQLYFANEEAGDEGRVFGVTLWGQATQLPRLGLFSWENTNVADTDSAATVVVGNEDGGSGQLRIYVGRKTAAGSAVQRAGLHNGLLNVLDVVDQSVSTDAEFRAAYGKGVAVPVRPSRIEWNATGAEQNLEAEQKGLALNRIEDGAFDPKHPGDYYFITTEGGDTTEAEPGVSRDGGGLWRLRFKDVSRPAAGMSLTLLLDGSEQPLLNKPDNMDIDRRGHLLIQEDPGGNDHVARVLAYDLASKRIATLAQFDPDHFAPGATAAPATTDEESSGILDVADTFGGGTFLFDAQVHTADGLSDPVTQVEHGQLLSMHVDWSEVFGSR